MALLHKFFNNQAQQLVQLKTANNILEYHAMESQGDTTDAATKAMSLVVQAILSNIPTGGHSPRRAKAAKPESFNGSRDKAKEFIQSICITVMMQLDTFSDKRMKILYGLSFM